ncbi:MAG: 5-(carboxyamino)imidazole ribonucleotide synthase [Lachnospiraceae bacterium]|nr:5-(carboxyamino)imidazole ribonucleotide synthase [Lachnospiraceae bacterium]
MTNQTHKTILPGQTIGIIGGGQLGRMMALAARAMGYRIAVLDPTPDCPCGQIADIEITASYNDLDAIQKLDHVSDVITYEFENIDYEALTYLEEQAYLPQGSELLKISQHRFLEKQAISALGIPVAPFQLIRNAQDLKNHLAYPQVLKTTTGGYDGKGQIVLRDKNDLQNALILTEQKECILENLIPFTKEISVIVIRSTSGEISVLPIAENKHVHNILHQTIVPARISAELEKKATEIGRTIADHFKLIGTLAIEMFVTEDNIYVNEIAPRPHNSGHFSMDACETGQFEQHIRAICGIPLGATTLKSPVVMVNILGEHMEDLNKYLPLLPNSKLHLYGKKEAVHKRKMGHINVLHDGLEQTFTKIDQTGIWK